MQPQSQSTTALEALIELLDLEKIEENLFRRKARLRLAARLWRAGAG